MKAVIFAGGVGMRLWPLSRKKSPKQFEKIVGDKSTLQLAVDRIRPEFAATDIYVATGADHADIVRAQLAEVPSDHVVGEPQMRDVGPAVGLMAAILNQVSPTEPMVILWSDHLVKNEALFRKVLAAAGAYVQKDPNKIVFISQKARFASTNLGWIEYGQEVVRQDGIALHAFLDFQYKPDESVAQKYFNSGKHAWNVGYFVTTPKFLLSLYQKFAPNLYAGIDTIARAWNTDAFVSTLNEIYPTLEKIHFDNAILEKLDSSSALVISEDIEWSDIGAWEALKEALEDSKAQNVKQGNVILTDTVDSLVYNYTDKLVATIDLDDMIVINTADVVLVCKKSSVGKIKKLVESMAGTEHDHLT
jgi:mannose-1-phosphate guanylyltransferase